jgi:hypothetical protein
MVEVHALWRQDAGCLVAFIEKPADRVSTHLHRVEVLLHLIEAHHLTRYNYAAFAVLALLIIMDLLATQLHSRHLLL